jgi:PKD repeat protein
VSAGPDAGREVGVPYALSATFTDPGGVADGPWSYTIAWGDGATTPSEGSGSTSTSPIAASHAYSATGQYTITVTVTDKDGGAGSDQAVVTVTAPTPNEAPIAGAGGPYTADNTVAFNGAGSDPDGNVPLTFRWTFHDGATSDVANPTRSYATEGTYEATLVVTDAKGLESAPSVASVTIANVAPTVNAGTDRSVQAGTALSLSVGFSDPGGAADGPFSWFIDWGDGARTPASGVSTTSSSPFSASHTYAAEGSYTAVVTTTDKDGGTGSDAVTVTVTPPGASFVVVGAGNIARCDYTNDDATAALLDAMTNATVFTTGDNIYGGGSLSDYQNCYGPNWGRHASRTRPTPGEEDYETSGASGYFTYFGSAAGSPGAGYYSYDLGSWHIIVLNSNIAMTAGSAQETWLRADLAGTTKQCILAYWHHPRFSSYSTSVRSEIKPLWDALYAAGADVVLNGHYRLYERFGLQNPDGGADAAAGIRQFTVGTGGHGVNSFGSPRPNSQVRISGAYGVLKLTLESNAYSWEFVPIAGQTFTDAGNTPCH